MAHGQSQPDGAPVVADGDVVGEVLFGLHLGDECLVRLGLEGRGGVVPERRDAVGAGGDEGRFGGRDGERPDLGSAMHERGA